MADELSDASRDVLAEPDIVRRLAEIGFEAQWTVPTEFAEHLAADIALWAALTKEAGIAPQ